jgi:hypothetical protein
MLLIIKKPQLCELPVGQAAALNLVLPILKNWLSWAVFFNRQNGLAVNDDSFDIY